MRRNQNSKPPLPEGWELLAVAYGTGRNDYLGVVLAFQHDQYNKYVTWTWNSDTGCEGVANGHYFDRPNYANDADLVDAAWNDFVQRSGSYIRESFKWAEIARGEQV
jgi:hypothetical protein